MKRKGKLNILCGRGGRNGDTMTIELIDEASGILFVSATTDLLSFMEALTAYAHRPIEFELNGIENVGKQYQSENVVLTFKRPESSDRKDWLKAARKAAKVHEKDGWRFSDYDLQYNHHKTKQGPTKGTVSLITSKFRYVDVKE